MCFMRTTLTLDTDVVHLLGEAMHRAQKPFKQVVNDAIRRGLLPQMNRPTKRPYRVKPYSGGLRDGLDLGHLNALNDELQVAEYALKAERKVNRQ